MSKRCFSICKNLLQTKCNTTRRCKYNIGKKREFCRLNMSKYKLNKDCVVKPKITNKNRVNEAAKVIQRNMKILNNRTKKSSSPASIIEPEHISPEHTPELTSAENKALKANIIHKFMFKTKFKRKAVYLNTICSNSGFCLALGKEEKNISEFFNNFVTFEYAISPIKTIGAASVNGFIKEIIYQRAKYKSYAILKSQQDVHADALFYEYLTGMYINTILNRFPNFVKTYGLLKYHTNLDLLKCRQTNLTVQEFKKLLSPVENINLKTPDLAALTCNPTNHLNCLLIEHINQPKTIKQLMSIGNTPILNEYDRHTLQYEIMYVLYQVYFALYCLKDNFTHFDLHSDNVLLYIPNNRGYIKYHYHTGRGIFVFYSQYLPKIIDYGRSFYKYDNTNNSDQIYRQLCTTAECNNNQQNCGKMYGHAFFANSIAFMNKAKNNISHDLRYANSVKKLTESWTQDTINLEVYNLFEVLQKVKYGVGVTKPADKKFGTKEVLGDKYKPKSKTINNIMEMKNALELLMMPLIPTDTYYTTPALGFVKLGDLHIYEDRPMDFIPA